MLQLQKVSEAQLVRSEGKMTHYSKGSEKPPMKGDVLRLYSMRFCPFAQVGFFFYFRELQARGTL